MHKQVDAIGKTVKRIILWFFLCLIIFEILGISLIAAGYFDIHIFSNPFNLFLSSGIISCSFSVFIAIIDSIRGTHPNS